MFLGLVVLILLGWGIYSLYKKGRENPPISGTRYYDAFPGQYQYDVERYKEYRKSHPSKEEKEKLAKEAAERKRRYRQEVEEHRKAEEFERQLNERLTPLFEEYDKDHFYDVTNQCWVKRINNDCYLKSYHWFDWDQRGRQEPFTEVDVGELITRKEYEAHEDYYQWNTTIWDENKDDDEDWV